VLGSHPLKAVATGGRNVLTHAGNIWDNYQVVFTYPGDVHVSFSSTQFGDFGFDVSERVYGADGMAEMPYSGPFRILGRNAWTWSDPAQAAASGAPAAPAKFAANGAFLDNLEFADREKDRAFIESITSGRYHNQVAAGVETALTCMLGRKAAYSGREVTWEQIEGDQEHWELGIDMQQFA
jgi:hypothetical protein